MYRLQYILRVQVLSKIYGDIVTAYSSNRERNTRNTIHNSHKYRSLSTGGSRAMNKDQTHGGYKLRD